MFDGPYSISFSSFFLFIQPDPNKKNWLVVVVIIYGYLGFYFYLMDLLLSTGKWREKRLLLGSLHLSSYLVCVCSQCHNIVYLNFFAGYIFVQKGSENFDCKLNDEKFQHVLRRSSSLKPSIVLLIFCVTKLKMFLLFFKRQQKKRSHFYFSIYFKVVHYEILFSSEKTQIKIYDDAI